MIPTIMLRLDVEAMKYKVVYAFMLRHEEIEREVQLSIDAALKGFDFNAIVKEAVDQELRKAVKQGVANAASAILWESPLREIIRDGAATKVREAIEASLK